VENGLEIVEYREWKYLSDPTCLRVVIGDWVDWGSWGCWRDWDCWGDWGSWGSWRDWEMELVFHVP